MVRHRGLRDEWRQPTAHATAPGLQGLLPLLTGSLRRDRPPGQQVIRFEFWKKPLSKGAGQGGPGVPKRVPPRCPKHRHPLTRLRLVLLVPHYTHQQERQERRGLKGLGAHLEVFTHQFFSRANELPSSPPCELLADCMLVERYQDVYGHVGDLPKINADNFWCRYLGGAFQGHSALQRRPGRHTLPPAGGALSPPPVTTTLGRRGQRPVTQWRDARTRSMVTWRPNRENPEYY
ncbi:hypothetical protein GWK47_028593 [Chionoecetes opilio]|uniref:Uncharacterized protein n=1 Tax=Chionoecetes opilio TaxID=41210 RepID=A0A8J5CRY0_CHIOP|nr:hypothetical protein GWK47_028593 [Chionoecetes opilio]